MVQPFKTGSGLFYDCPIPIRSIPKVDPHLDLYDEILRDRQRKSKAKRFLLFAGLPLPSPGSQDWQKKFPRNSQTKWVAWGLLADVSQPQSPGLDCSQESWCSPLVNCLMYVIVFTPTIRGTLCGFPGGADLGGYCMDREQGGEAKLTKGIFPGNKAGGTACQTTPRCPWLLLSKNLLTQKPVSSSLQNKPPEINR